MNLKIIDEQKCRFWLVYLGGMAFLSFLQVICGVGSPVAIQTKVAMPPAFTRWLMGASLITGGSAKEKQRQISKSCIDPQTQSERFPKGPHHS